MRRPPGATLQLLRASPSRYVPITFALIRNLFRENFGSNFARFCASKKRKFGQKNWLYIGWFVSLLHTSGGSKRVRIFVKKTEGGGEASALSVAAVLLEKRHSKVG